MPSARAWRGPDRPPRSCEELKLKESRKVQRLTRARHSVRICESRHIRYPRGAGTCPLGSPSMMERMSRTAPVPRADQAVPSGGFSHREIVTILSGLMLGMFLAALDQTVV